MSNPPPPAFDRRSRPHVEWFRDDSGQYAVKATGGGFEVDISATNFAYAANITKLILDAAPPRAFEPVADSTTTVADATTAEPPTVPEGHPALADAEDNVGDLKAGEAV